MNTELKNRRLQLGLTQKQVADRVGVSEATVSRWESGDIANMRRDRIAGLADALRTTPDFIMTGLAGPRQAPPGPTPEESQLQEMLEKLRRLTPENRSAALAQLDLLLTRQEKQEN